MIPKAWEDAAIYAATVDDPHDFMLDAGPLMTIWYRAFDFDPVIISTRAHYRPTWNHIHLGDGRYLTRLEA